MFDPIYDLKQQKRNFPDDSSHYVPSFKKTRMWDGSNLNESQQSSLNVDLMDISFIQNESSHLQVMTQPEYFPSLYVGVNHPLEVDMVETTKFKYMPDLNAAQNPYYYEYNKLLFELYLERTRRSKFHNPSSRQSHI